MSDDSLQLRVIEQIRWEPGIDSSHIGVIVLNGFVTLHGAVKTFIQQEKAIKAAARTRGVTRVVNKITVDPADRTCAKDTEIEERLRQIFRWNVATPNDTIKIEVRDGEITLTGEVKWDYQRQAAARMARLAYPASGIANRIGLQRNPIADQVAADIASSLRRQASLNADDISVSVQGRTVVLSGNVKSATDRRLVEKSVFSAPGVEAIINRLVVTETDPAVLFPLAG